jgi:ribulose-phosphate 3-epimerase
MEQKTRLLAPSLLSADFGAFGDAVERIQKAGADWVHLDVMDGSFVPTLTFGPQTAAALRPRTKLPLDAHLMVENPGNFIQSFAAAGADFFTFHVEAEVLAHRLIQNIRETPMKPGISLVPSTPVSALEEILPLVDLVLVMTVNPGFGGQKLIPACVEKIARLAEIRKAKGYSYLISADGGVTLDNAASMYAKGADVLVAGNAFFTAPDPALAVRKLKGLE